VIRNGISDVALASIAVGPKARFSAAYLIRSFVRNSKFRGLFYFFSQLSLVDCLLFTNNWNYETKNSHTNNTNTGNFYLITDKPSYFDYMQEDFDAHPETKVVFLKFVVVFFFLKKERFIIFIFKKL
jgi:hypothetical protein